MLALFMLVRAVVEVEHYSLPITGGASPFETIFIIETTEIRPHIILQAHVVSGDAPWVQREEYR
jgi:hypothetical protein